MKDYIKRPIAFILSSTSHGVMIVNRFDRMIVNEKIHGVGHQLLTKSFYDPKEVICVLQILHKRRQYYGDGVVAIDCGANLGVHTIEWAQEMTQWGEVISFEAQEHIFYALAGNVALNNLFNVRVKCAAVGKEIGQINVPKLNYFKQSSFGSLELKEIDSPQEIGQHIDRSEANSTQVQLKTIDSLDLERVDFIKMDIEGMELEALEGASATLKRCKPALLVETAKSGREKIYGFLKSHDYRLIKKKIAVYALHKDDPIYDLFDDKEKEDG